MELLAQDFHFKSNSIYGSYNSETKIDSITNTYNTDLSDNCGTSIRVYGTQQQINKAVNEYMKNKPIYLDECYNFKVEPKGSYWYNILENPEEHNKMVAKKLKKYKAIYKEKKKPLILNLI